jgi:hypothetical protein
MCRCIAADRFDFRCRGFEAGAIAAGNQCDMATAPCEFQGCRSADTRRGTCHDGNLPVEYAHLSIPFFDWSGNSSRAIPLER